MEERLKSIVEIKIFGVCTYLAKYLGISISTVRKYFIYLSILTLGSPVILYLVIHFWLQLGELRDKHKKHRLWDIPTED